MCAYFQLLLVLCAVHMWIVYVYIAWYTTHIMRVLRAQWTRECGLNRQLKCAEIAPPSASSLPPAPAIAAATASAHCLHVLKSFQPFYRNQIPVPCLPRWVCAAHARRVLNFRRRILHPSWEAAMKFSMKCAEFSIEIVIQLEAKWNTHSLRGNRY